MIEAMGRGVIEAQELGVAQATGRDATQTTGRGVIEAMGRGVIEAQERRVNVVQERDVVEAQECGVIEATTGHGVIEARSVGYRVEGREILNGIDLTVHAGELFGIIGPNGSGKSTLLKLMSGLERRHTGVLMLDGKAVGSYSRKELARRLAVLQQEGLPPIGFTVREVVEMGRFPYRSWLGGEQGEDAKLIDEIMGRLDLEALAERTLERLSGGERQRVALAKTMAQQPQMLLLDEPTSFLDISYQLQLMDYVRAWQKEAGLTTVAVLHDLNLAALYCDRLLVLHEGRVFQTGTPTEVLTSETIRAVYGTQTYPISHPTAGVPQLLLRPAHVEGSEPEKH